MPPHPGKGFLSGPIYGILSQYHKQVRRYGMNQYLDMFLTFAKVGVMTFGGGYAMLPILQREVVEKKGWATEEELMDYFAIGQCTPGIIAVNVATFCGQKLKGVLGGIFATLGMVFPSLVIISLLAGFWPIIALWNLFTSATSGLSK